MVGVGEEGGSERRISVRVQKIAVNVVFVEARPNACTCSSWDCAKLETEAAGVFGCDAGPKIPSSNAEAGKPPELIRERAPLQPEVAGERSSKRTTLWPIPCKIARGQKRIMVTTDGFEQCASFAGLSDRVELRLGTEKQPPAAWNCHPEPSSSLRNHEE